MANKFGTREMQRLIDDLRVAAEDFNIVIDHTAADRFSAVLRDAADTLDGAERYYMAVESSLI